MGDLIIMLIVFFVLFLFMIIVAFGVEKVAKAVYKKIYKNEPSLADRDKILALEILIILLFSFLLTGISETTVEYILKSDGRLIEHTELRVFNHKMLEVDKIIPYVKEK